MSGRSPMLGVTAYPSPTKMVGIVSSLENIECAPITPQGSSHLPLSDAMNVRVSASTARPMTSPGLPNGEPKDMVAALASLGISVKCLHWVVEAAVRICLADMAAEGPPAAELAAADPSSPREWTTGLPMAWIRMAGTAPSLLATPPSTWSASASSIGHWLGITVQRCSELKSGKAPPSVAMWVIQCAAFACLSTSAGSDDACAKTIEGVPKPARTPTLRTCWRPRPCDICASPVTSALARISAALALPHFPGHSLISTS
mmetsp:Transcript_15228/g.57485  ORF Transcript_15228/g.57485 Transcript_15228/m.57485 type:complete len:260 (+) Transcript_15228:1427-2206(+)